jgi:hypothetical protein
MSEFLEIFYDGWGDLVAWGLFFDAIIVLGVLRARRMRLASRSTSHAPATTAEHLSDIRRGIGLGTNMFGVSVATLYITVGIISVVAFAILIAFVLVPRDQYLLVAICSVPFVVGAGYVVYRSERWFFRRVREFRS